MNHWNFVIAAYALTLVGTLGAGLWSWLSMRKAEQAADRLRDRR